MQNDGSTSDLMRRAGIMAVCVAIAWVLQIIGTSGTGSSSSSLMWILGAASIAGAGAGAIFTAAGLREREATVQF